MESHFGEIVKFVGLIAQIGVIPLIKTVWDMHGRLSRIEGRLIAIMADKGIEK